MKTAITLRNDLGELERLHAWITDFGISCSLSPRSLHAVNLALEEIVTNVISYAYDDGARHFIDVRLEMHGEEVIAEVEDDGKPFNPLEAPPPDLTTPIEDRAAGGLGIFIARSSVSTLAYVRRGGKNVLTMKKRIEPSEA
jgi:anti-sigma regulatory factor (Ser/Thr protein kinase)